jgi:Short C-terminal domain
MLRRRRPLLRAAAVGGAAYYAGKKVQEGRDQDPSAVDDGSFGDEQADEQSEAPAGISQEAIDRIEELSALKERGVLTQDEFEAEKQKILTA